MKWIKLWTFDPAVRFSVGQVVLYRQRDGSAARGEVVAEVQRGGRRIIEDIDFDGTPMSYEGCSLGLYRIRTESGEELTFNTGLLDSIGDYEKR